MFPMSSVRRFVACVAAQAVLSLGVSAPLWAQTGTQTELPAGENRALVATICTQCHGLRTTLLWRAGETGWKREVDEMILRGARITPEEANTIARYLGQNLGPDSKPSTAAASANRTPAGNATVAKAITLPTGPGKELVETQCTLCHDLNRVVVQRKSLSEWQQVTNDMTLARGTKVSPEQIQAIVSYLSSQFGK